MDTSRLKQIYEQKAQSQEAEQKFELAQKNTLQTQEVIAKSFKYLIEYLDKRTSKTEVVNQLASIGTPDALKVVDALKSLHETIKTHKNTDLSELTDLMRSLVDEAKQIPKELPPEKEEQFIDYSDQLKAMLEAVQSLEQVVKEKETVLKASDVTVTPEINVEAPDLQPLKTEISNVVKAVKGIVFPEYVNDYSKLEKLVEKSNKILKDLLEKPISSAGSGGGRATPYQDSNGIPTFVELSADGKVPVTFSSSTDPKDFYVYDIEDGTTSYFGSTNVSGAWMLKSVSDTLVSYATVTNNGTVTSYTDAWTNRATLTYGRIDEAF